MSKTHFTISGQSIPWSFFHRVKKRYGLKRAQEVFWMCRGKRNIIGYISSGIKNNWFSINTVELDRNKTACEAWCRDTFDKKIPVEKKRKGPQEITSISDILKSYSTE